MWASRPLQSAGQDQSDAGPCSGEGCGRSNWHARPPYPPGKGLLIGLEAGLGKWSTNDIVSSFRPIFSNKKGEEVPGQQIGNAAGNPMFLKPRPATPSGHFGKSDDSGGRILRDLHEDRQGPPQPERVNTSPTGSEARAAGPRRGLAAMGRRSWESWAGLAARNARPWG